MIRRALRHPSVRILACGVLVAVAILIAKGPPTGDEARRVIVTGADLLQLRAAFQRTWRREPTAAELRRQLEQHVRQEVLYREALARGYDRDDPVVRQAMQRKMEFLASAQVSREPPTDEEVEAFFSLQQDRYRLPAVVSLAQVYVNPDARGGAAEDEAAELLALLRRDDPEPAALADWGDPILLEPVYRAQAAQDIASQFGEEFAAAVLAVELGDWVGPIHSGYGLHLVKVLGRQDSRIPELREVVTRVLSDMEYEASRAAKEQLYQEIVQNYQVVLDRPVRDLLAAVDE